VKSDSNNNEQIKFSLDHRAIMWICTKGVLKKEEDRILKIINKGLKGKEISFYGHCFGRVDLIIEFVEGSAKVASNYVCNLQEQIVSELRKSNQNILDPVSSSLSLCNKVLYDGSRKGNSKSKIRTYTFLRPKSKGVNLEEVVKTIKKLDRKYATSNMEIFWTSSTYTFLLTINGNVFHPMFSKLIKFRDATSEYFSESCTYVGLGWECNDAKGKKKIRANTFVKLKSGFGELELNKKIEDDWNRIDKRLGWSDLCLEIEKPTLRAIKEAILKLRESHRNEIVSTSTLLLPPHKDIGGK